MAPREHDAIDYIDDDTQDEDVTLFLPVRPDSAVDGASGFLGGVLAGVSGGALAQIVPWLAGLLIFAGYGMAACALGGSRSLFARSLSFGFTVLAVAGAAMALGGMFFPRQTWSILSAISERHALFLSVAALAWPIGFARYLYLWATKGKALRRAKRA
ncbi:MAG: hypothetical protein WAN43_14765 [Rhodomicrobium sp.]|jgi:hypothetical protein